MFIKKIVTALLIFTLLTIPIFAVQRNSVNATIENIPFIVENINLGEIKVLTHNNTTFIPTTILSKNLNYKIEEKNYFKISYPKSYLDINECNPLEGEEFIYGQIIGIDKLNKTIKIEQHIDDSSPIINYNLQLKNDCIIVLKRNDRAVNISFSDLKVGDVIGGVLTNEHVIRGLILDV